jgi:hypothetical protein
MGVYLFHNIVFLGRGKCDSGRRRRKKFSEKFINLPYEEYFKFLTAKSFQFASLYC